MSSRFLGWNFAEEIQKIKPTAEKIISGATTQREKAVKIYNYVRDEIKFGFTSEFDRASPSYTLEKKIGHCNPKGALIHALFSAVGIPSRMRFVQIKLNPLITTSFEDNGVHMFLDVQVDSEKNEWVTTDGYVVDKPVLIAGVEELKRANQTVGHFAHVKASAISEWDGITELMSQYAGNEIRTPGGFEISLDKDESLEDFYSSDKYPQRDAQNSWIGRTMMSWFFVPWTNKSIEKQRAAGLVLLAKAN